jgi:hypothetical protein
MLIFRNFQIFAPTLKNNSRNEKNSPQLYILSFYVLVTSSLIIIKKKNLTEQEQIENIFIKKGAHDRVSYFWKEHTCCAFAYIANISSKDFVEKESLFMTTVGAFHKGASCD